MLAFDLRTNQTITVKPISGEYTENNIRKIKVEVDELSREPDWPEQMEVLWNIPDSRWILNTPRPSKIKKAAVKKATPTKKAKTK